VRVDTDHARQSCAPVGMRTRVVFALLGNVPMLAGTDILKSAR
jgi:hypothetical protein